MVIRYRGVQVYSDPNAWPGIAAYEHPLLWWSDATGVRGDPGRPQARLSCALRLLTPKRWQGAAAFRKDLKKQWGSMLTATPKHDPDEEELVVDYLARHDRLERDWEKTFETVRRARANPATR